MSTVTLESLIDDIEARLVAEVAGVRILDRLDSPRDNPKHAAHLGVRVWPTSTSVVEQYAETDHIRVEDEITIEAVYKVTRDADSSLDGALAFERSIRNAITAEAWYDSRNTADDRIEVFFDASTREKEHGWLIIEQTYRVHRDATLGGSL